MCKISPPVDFSDSQAWKSDFVSLSDFFSEKVLCGQDQEEQDTDYHKYDVLFCNLCVKK